MPAKQKISERREAVTILENLHGRSPATPQGTRIVAFANFKGGVGKTTCAVNVAGCLAHNFNKKVLLVDLDVQSSLGQWLLGPQQWENWSKHRIRTTYQIFMDIIQGSHAWTIDTSTFSYPGCPSLRISPASFDMINLDVQLHSALHHPNQPRAFQCLDIQIKKVCGQFDYVIFDCPPNMFYTTQNGLFCADYILIPTQPDFLSKAGLKKLVGFLKELRDQFLILDPQPAKIAGVIINMFDARKTTLSEHIEEVVGYVNQVKHENDVFLKRATVFQQRIRNLSDIAKAQDEHLPVSMALPNSEASKDFLQLTDQIMEVLENG